jgi:glycosyltransferase involved in cell wall biosynthesis
MMTRLRIFVDCHVFDGSFQGTTTYIKGIYKELVKDSSIQFYLGANDISHVRQVFGDQPNIKYLTYARKNKFYRLLWDIPRLLKRHKIDIAHFQYIVPPVKPCIYITTIHDVLFLDYPHLFPATYKLRNNFLFKWSARRADVVLTVSSYSQERIRAHFGIDDVFVTPNAVDPLFFEPFSKKELQERVLQKFGLGQYWLYVSRWEPRKNHHAILKVFIDNGWFTDYHLVFVGDKAIDNADFDNLYKSLTDAQRARVVMLSKVSFPDLVLLTRAASLAVYPSIAEGFGIPPLEAAAAGVPVSCSGSSAMSDFTFFGQHLFDPASVHDMQRAISLIMEEPARDLGESIRSKYDWAASASIMRTIFTRIAK